MIIYRWRCPICVAEGEASKREDAEKDKEQHIAFCIKNTPTTGGKLAQDYNNLGEVWV